MSEAALHEARRLLAATLEQTPEPAEGADPEVVVERGQAMLSARRPLFAALEQVVEVIGRAAIAADEACNVLLVQLDERQERWNAAMRQARHVAGERLRGASSLRRRGGSYGG